MKSYNQRRYLTQALEGAWSQAYRPLEIVVSDDGSTDGSWEEIRSFAASHPLPAGVTLVLSRNCVSPVVFSTLPPLHRPFVVEYAAWTD